MNKRIWIVSFILLIVGVIVYFSLSHKTPNVELIMSPADSLAKLDGTKQVRAGSFYVSPGPHTITASFNGFSSTQTSFTTKTSGMQKVYVILQPNSQAGYDWLTSHPSDQQTREGYGGQNYAANTNTLQQKNSIIQYLPFIGSGQAGFRIDYSFPQNSSDPVTVIITYYTEVGKAHALTWLQNKGYPPSTLKLQFVNATAAAASDS